MMNNKLQISSINKFLVVGILSLILFFSLLGGTSVCQSAECTREMPDCIDWVVSTFNGEL